MLFTLPSATGVRGASFLSLQPPALMSSTTLLWGPLGGRLENGRRSQMEPQKHGSASPLEAARGYSTGSTHEASANSTVWHGLRPEPLMEPLMEPC
jgi:hypothetical protein